MPLTSNKNLGAAIGTEQYKNEYIQEKVDEWCKRLKVLTKMAHSNPQAAYAAYIFGEQHKYTYFLRTLQLPLIRRVSFILKRAIFESLCNPRPTDLY